MTKQTLEKDQDSLVKTSAEGAVELSETELNRVAGGQKNKTDEFLKYKLSDVIISSY